MVYLFLLLILAGCARLPKEETECTRIDTPSLERTVQEARAEGPFMKGDFPDPYWWQLFEDDQLNCFIEMAIADEPGLKAAEARLKASEQAASMQKVALYPMVGLYAQGAQQYFGKNGFFRAFAPTFPGRINEYIVSLNFSYEFDFWGKNRNLFEAALGEARAQAALTAQVRIMLSTSLALAYFSWQVEKRKVALLEELSKLREARLDLISMRKEGSLDSQQQKLHSDSQLAFVGKELAGARQLLRLCEDQLKMLLGMGPDDPLEIEVRALPQDARISLPEELSCNLLARRPDLMALIWRAEAAAHRVGAARADFYPSINLTALVGLDSVFLGKFFTWPSREANAIPALNLPIFTGGFLRAQLKERQAEFEEANYAYNAQLLTAVREVADQIATVQKMQTQVELQSLIVQQKAETTELVKKKNRAAMSSTLELIDSKEVLIQEQITALYDQLGRLSAMVGLIKALGGGFHCQ